MSNLKFVVICFVLLAFQAQAIDIRPWASASALWGQGSIGSAFVHSNKTVAIYDSFVWDWDDKEISYNELVASLAVNRYIAGSRLRTQDGNDEVAPFCGVKLNYYQNKQFLFKGYNEIEYRNNPYEFDSDYFRGQIYTHLSYKQGMLGEKALRPYIANAYFFNASDVAFEKNRVYIGYSVELKEVSFGFYYIPWVMGETGGEWDDNKNFGAYINFFF